MTSRARRRLHITVWALCCLLVSQWALAAHVCPADRGEGTAATRLLEVAAAASAAPDCHGAAADLDHALAGGDVLCIKHCADERGASGGVLTLTAAAVAPPTLLRLLVEETPLPALWVQAQPPGCANATAPPLTILYCVFRT